MSADSPLETIARHLTEIRQSIFDNGHDGWKSDDALSLLGRIREIATYLNEPDDMAPTGSRDDYAMLVGLEIRQDIIVNAHRLVIELIGASLADDIQRLALDTQGALIRASDPLPRSPGPTSRRRALSTDCECQSPVAPLRCLICTSWSFRTSG